MKKIDAQPGRNGRGIAGRENAVSCTNQNGESVIRHFCLSFFVLKVMVHIFDYENLVFSFVLIAEIQYSFNIFFQHYQDGKKGVLTRVVAQHRDQQV
jgi:hypothetical protein